MIDNAVNRFKRLAPAVDFWSIRLSDSRLERIKVRQNIVEPLFTRRSTGALISIVEGNGMGYAATADVTDNGLKQAAKLARDRALNTAEYQLFESRIYPQAVDSGNFQSNVDQPWDTIPLSAKLDYLQATNKQLKIHDQIVEWWTFLENINSQVIFATANDEIVQQFNYLTPALCAVAHNGKETQSRSYGMEYVAQTGFEHLDHIKFQQNASRVGEEAVRLLSAQNCPSGEFDLLLQPNQMALQIHESIGHPLELDRILGDERNYAGTSFVSLDMFGRYQYGSPLLNITFDPTTSNQVASYAFDDEGTAATRTYLIKDGLLLHPLGGATSQKRAKINGVANSRSCDWNRAPIDRMGNINLEPGNSAFDDMIESVDYGVLMDTNRSWSIDDSRNKFQFGCELGRLIVNGKITGLLKNPNYRGISATFWRSLEAVGNRSTFEHQGVTTCGKGEPNQAIQVGHGAPACLFRNVAIFGAN